MAALLFLFSQKAAAQIEIGLKVSPSLTYLRTSAPAAFNLQSEGSKVGIGFGVVADYFFGTNYAFSSGLLFNSKGGSISVQPDGAGKMEQEVGLHYIEIPLALKLYTNEIATDTRVYFMAGGSLNTLVGARIDGEKADAEGDKYTKQFNLFEFGALLGAGAELQMGPSTKIFGGLSYHHGLTNVDDNLSKGNSNVEIKNSGFSLDLGIKF
ncbi:porin family protein [Rufibacter sp. LB8]|uniref:porin family protein n=1 Tax=Rufibacter sp. LB8 TaxID=2777781 RepID=UPI00178C7CC5|nr:porin family protein [Rufibacter sp. LB8]